jgi:hypothetical protein
MSVDDEPGECMDEEEEVEAAEAAASPEMEGRRPN